MQEKMTMVTFSHFPIFAHGCVSTGSDLPTQIIPPATVTFSAPSAGEKGRKRPSPLLPLPDKRLANWRPQFLPLLDKRLANWCPQFLPLLGERAGVRACVPTIIGPASAICH